MRRGIELRAKELQTQQTKYDYKFCFEDACFGGREVTLAFRKVTSINGAKAIISFGGDSAKILKHLSADRKVYHMGFAFDPSVVDGEYSFLDACHPSIAVQTLIDYLKDKGYRHPYLITQTAPSSTAVSAKIKEGLKATGINCEGETFIITGERDFRSIIVKISSESHADIFVLNIYTPEEDICLKQLHIQVPSIPCTSVGFFDDMNDKGPIEGFPYVTIAQPTQAFIDKLALNKVPNDYMTAHGYDMADLLIASFEAQAKGQTPGDFLRSLKNYPGAIGSLTMAPDGVIDSLPKLVVVKNGKRVVLE